MRHRESGNAVIEMTFVGIPLIFVLISLFEMARGMWVYHTLAHAIKEGTRYAIVHGYNCASVPNTCAVRISDIAARIKEAGVGLDENELLLTFTSATRQIPGSGGQSLSVCLTDNTYWPTYAAGVIPPDDGASVGLNLTITGVYPFRSAIALLWPGAGKGINFPAVNFPASSTEKIQF